MSHGFRVIKKNKYWAGVIIYNPETKTVLMQRRDSMALVNPNVWALFGGVGEKDELPEDCAVREVSEEAGLTISKIKLQFLGQYFYEDLGEWRYVYFLSANFSKSDVNLSEGETFDFISVEEIQKYSLAHSTRKDIELFFKAKAVKKT